MKRKDRRDFMLYVRLTHKELDEYKKLAATKGTTLSALIRVTLNKLIETAEDTVF